MVQRVGRGIALLFHGRGTRRGGSGHQHVPAALYPREKPDAHFRVIKNYSNIIKRQHLHVSVPIDPSSGSTKSYKACFNFPFLACSRTAGNSLLCNIYVVCRVMHRNWNSLLCWRCSPLPYDDPFKSKRVVKKSPIHYSLTHSMVQSPS